MSHKREPIRSVPITITIPDALLSVIRQLRSHLGMAENEGINAAAEQIFMAGMRRLMDDDDFLKETRKMIANQRQAKLDGTDR